MKFGNARILKKNISEYTENNFEAIYKGRSISISTSHGFGKAEYDDEKRFNIDVVHIKSGMIDVSTYEDFENIEKAILYSLKGAMLI